jgi:hypothetical protein
MAVIGFSDLRNNTLPALWDGDYFKRLELRDGTSFEAMVQRASQALAGFNGEILSMPHYSGLFAVQNTPELKYAIGTSNEWKIATEYGMPDPARGKTEGHMLPINPYDWGMGWTEWYLREHYAEDLDANIQSMVDSLRKLWQKTLLTRFFSDVANTVASTALADLPFANSTNDISTYIPPVSPQGEEFENTHDHVLGYGTSGVTQDTFDVGAVDVCVEHLQEHGYDSPYEMIVSRTDISSWAAVTGFKPPNWADINYHASAVERSAFSDINSYIGSVETKRGIVKMWETPRIPTKHAGLYKAGEPGSEGGAGAPLRVRYDEQYGFGFNLVPGTYVTQPTFLVVGFGKFGVGVGNRLNGVLLDLAASTYSAPSIS